MRRVNAGERIDHEHALNGEKLALMAVFANPGEEAFGPAGTLARYASEGVRVSMVTVARERPTADGLLGAHVMPGPLSREKSCSCLTSGTHRICLLDYPGGRIDLGDETAMHERLVRMIREQRPQVIVTYGPGGFGDPDHPLISRLATRAFHLAGDPACHPEHLGDGLNPFQPKKLYYSIVPQSAIERWRLTGLVGVPDSSVTTVLQVSGYTEAKLRTFYCQRNHVNDYTGWMGPGDPVEWDQEYFVLAASQLHRRLRKEQDLFAGLR